MSDLDLLYSIVGGLLRQVNDLRKIVLRMMTEAETATGEGVDWPDPVLDYAGAKEATNYEHPAVER